MIVLTLQLPNPALSLYAAVDRCLEQTGPSAADACPIACTSTLQAVNATIAHTPGYESSINLASSLLGEAWLRTTMMEEKKLRREELDIQDGVHTDITDPDAERRVLRKIDLIVLPMVSHQGDR